MSHVFSVEAQILSATLDASASIYVTWIHVRHEHLLHHRAIV